MGGEWSEAMYEQVQADVAALAEDSGDPGKFMGGIVRLCAHDFMDYKAGAWPRGGPKGCVQFDDDENAGLSDIWADGTALKDLYDADYAPLGVTIADFWVAAANGAIAHSSGGILVPSFVWGRADAAECKYNALRLPGAHSCSEVERVFIENMRFTWRQATALMGAHTIGHASSNHVGNWVEPAELTAVFDNKLFERDWVPNAVAADGLAHDWTWGTTESGPKNIMLTTDVCLFYDVETIDGTRECCTAADLPESGCDAFAEAQCPKVTAGSASRLDGVEAVIEYAEDNDYWLFEFHEAWTAATTIGLKKQLYAPVAECTPGGFVPPTEAPTAACSDDASWRARRPSKGATRRFTCGTC
ncbi:heme peroxidase [Pelagophyceae sp. CCMP2097]|nr:heme peroxidase [Pelagophyceae sp. CCMP2097]